MKGSVIGSFIMNIFLAGSLSYMISMMNSLQILVHLPLINLVAPANVMTLEAILVPVVMFDVFEIVNNFIEEHFLDHDHSDE
jgi:hypothetical protein